MLAISIKAAREGVVRKRHPWIFSGAIAAIPPEVQPGDICQVVSTTKAVLGYAMVNPSSDLVARMVSFERTFHHDRFIEERLGAAWNERHALVPATISTAFRLINAEGDCLPGLIIDCYGDTAVVQISTMGMERLKPRVVDELIRRGVTAIYEKSNAPARLLEGLPKAHHAWLQGGPQAGEHPTTISEHGLRYQVAVESGQKTGFFLDQREMRLLLRQFAPGKSVLNCFAYSGGFSFNALHAGAAAVVSIDSSAAACALLHRNAELNGLSTAATHQIMEADVGEYLRTSKEKFDVIVLDPPPYIKKAKDRQRGLHHYLELNRLGMQRLKPGGTLFTFSCSPLLLEGDWHHMLAMAMAASGRFLRVLGDHRHALDHPVALSHPEGRYIRGGILKETL